MQCNLQSGMAHASVPPGLRARLLPTHLGRHPRCTVSRQQCIRQHRQTDCVARSHSFVSALCLSGLRSAHAGLHLPRSAAVCPSDGDSHWFEQLENTPAASRQHQQQLGYQQQQRQQAENSERRESRHDSLVLQQQQLRRQRATISLPPAWPTPSAAQVRAVAYLVLGSLLAWCFVAVQMRSAAGGGFASLTLGGSFHSASQTGVIWPH